ncbi:Rv1476 family membrane protein [Rhodococcus sp. NPDC003348]
MPAAHTIAFLPAPADIPPGVDIDTVLADLADDGVSAPSGDVAGLQAVVARAQEHGLNLRVVVLAENPGRDSQLRDIATEVGVHDGGTVLVLSPSWVGTYSDSLPRVSVEDAQDRAYTGNAVDSANQFLDTVIQPDAPYGLITIALVLVVGGGAAATWMLRTRRLGAGRADS